MSLKTRLHRLEGSLGVGAGNCACRFERTKPGGIVGILSEDDWQCLDPDPCPRCGRPRRDFSGAMIVLAPGMECPPDLRRRLGNPNPDCTVVGFVAGGRVDLDKYGYERPSRAWPRGNDSRPREGGLSDIQSRQRVDA